jgi:hypothetical protein
MKLTLPAMLDEAYHPSWFVEVIGRGRGVPGFGNFAPYLSSEVRGGGRGSNLIATKLDFTIN